jgi:hypothetical protein
MSLKPSAGLVEVALEVKRRKSWALKHNDPPKRLGVLADRVAT